MMHLVYKEFKLVCHPTAFMFTLFGAMLLIPNYPYFVPFFYGTLGIFFCFLTARENKDNFYMVSLPIGKREAVNARVYLMVLLELAELVVSIPFAIISIKMNPNGGNGVGIEPNLAFFGLVLIFFGIFNFVFLLQFYKTGYSVGRGFLWGSIAETVFMIMIEILDHMPSVGTYLEIRQWSKMWIQVPVLLVGCIMFFLLTFFGSNIAAKRFEKVDLS